MEAGFEVLHAHVWAVGCRLLLVPVYQHVKLSAPSLALSAYMALCPAMMIKDKSSETVNEPQFNVFLHKSCSCHDVSSEQKKPWDSLCPLDFWQLLKLVKQNKTKQRAGDSTLGLKTLVASSGS